MSDLVRIPNCWFSHAQAQFPDQPGNPCVLMVLGRGGGGGIKTLHMVKMVMNNQVLTGVFLVFAGLWVKLVFVLNMCIFMWIVI